MGLFLWREFCCAWRSCSFHEILFLIASWYNALKALFDMIPFAFTYQLSFTIAIKMLCFSQYHLAFLSRKTSTRGSFISFRSAIWAIFLQFLLWIILPLTKHNSDTDIQLYGSQQPPFDLKVRHEHFEFDRFRMVWRINEFLFIKWYKL